jgi:CRP-like cAMP-binding protein
MQPSTYERSPMKWRPFRPIKASAPSAFPAFAPIVSDAFEHLQGIPEGVNVERGESVLEQGKHPTSVCLLRQGLVKLVHVTPAGRETLLGLRAAGWYAGAVPVLTNSPSIYSVETLTPCIFSKVPAEEFSTKLRQSARMMRHFMNTLCNELIAQSAEAQVKVSSAEERLDQFMSERSLQYPQLKTLDPLPALKQMELAQLLAITPEHLSRLLRKAGTVRPDEDV